MSVRAVRNTAAGVTVEDLEEPGGDGVIVDVVASGICGSDLQMIKWGPLPFTLGHEIGGRLSDGTPVTVWPLVPCDTCDRCLAGEPQQCRTATARLYGVSMEGGMADRMLVDPRNVIPLPEGVTADNGCLVEPIACSVHAFRRASVARASRVAVVGAGSIGLGATAVARHWDCPVDVSARHPHQQRAARAMGAGIEPSGEYEVVVDAAGSSESIARCFELVQPGGTVLVVSSQWKPIEFPTFFANREAHVVTAAMHGRGHGVGGGAESGTDMQAAAQLLADLPEVAGALITHRFPLAEAAHAFDVAADRAAGAIKIVLTP